MSPVTNESGARLARWLLRRNPLYLLSATCIAVGARMYLVRPEAAPGDVDLILATLVVLQVYEWAVGGLIVLLHRTRRSPEDQPSLLLVAALFWTGPMAATMEMTVLDPQAGTGLAMGACIIALGEMELLRKTLGLRFSLAGRAAATACVNLVALSPPLLVVRPRSGGSNELFLYAAWWALAGIAVLGIASLEAHRRMRLAGRAGHQRCEQTFVTLAVAAVAIHLIGMNHAFFGHARLFYAAPLLAAAAAVGMEALRSRPRPDPTALLAFALLPVVGMVLSVQPFHPDVPIRRLALLDDPLRTGATLAACVWGLGYWGHRRMALFHSAAAALGVALLRSLTDGSPADGVFRQAWSGSARTLVMGCCFAAAAYFLIVAAVARLRLEALAGLAASWAGVCVAASGRMEGDGFVIGMALTWTLWIGAHVLTSRPGLGWRFGPAVVLAVWPWFYDADPVLNLAAQIHAGLLVCVLLGAAIVLPGVGYGVMGWATLAVQAGFRAGQGVMHWQTAWPGLVVAAGFVLLAGGGWISWHKGALLTSVRPTASHDEAKPSAAPLGAD